MNYGAGNPFDISQVVLSDFRVILDADFDDDGDGADLAQWQGDFGVNDMSDADGDGDSDGADFLAWQQQQHTPPAQVAVAAVPEPELVILAVMALAAHSVRARRCARH